MSYFFLKNIHITLVAISGALFLLRGLWMLARSPLLQASPVKRLPHLVDSLLLASALGLAIWSGQSPTNSTWLLAKVGALIAYILLGALALSYGRTMAMRATALLAATGCYAYMVTTAITKNPLFFL